MSDYKIKADVFKILGQAFTDISAVFLEEDDSLPPGKKLKDDPKKEVVKKDTKAKKEVKKKDATEGEPKVPTIEEITEAVTALKDEQGMDAVKEIYAKYNAAKFTNIPKAKWAEALDAIKEGME